MGMSGVGRVSNGRLFEEMTLLDKLPGILMPVSDVPDALRELWKSDPDSGTGPTKFRAVQTNLILHFGLDTSETEAQGILGRALEFAQRYPCRLICLCPSRKDDAHLMRGKLFSQCYLSGGARHPVCCEALMLGYSPEESKFLEHQVSIWLESDLPTYHWFHRVPAHRIRESYMPFLKMVRRVTFDSSLEGHAYEEISWPCPRGARDLAEARLLHVRQSLGQFLSSYSVEMLTQGLHSITINHASGLAGEAGSLARWAKKCLVLAGTAETLTTEIFEKADGFCMEWAFEGSSNLLMELNNELCAGRIRADFGPGPVDYPLHMKKVSSQLTLAEALFF
jgi:hypothetical protein